MANIPESEFNKETLDELASGLLKNEKALIKGGFHQSEIDGTIPEYQSRPADMETVREELKKSVKRLNS